MTTTEDFDLFPRLNAIMALDERGRAIYVAALGRELMAGDPPEYSGPFRPHLSPSRRLALCLAEWETLGEKYGRKRTREVRRLKRSA